MWSLQASIAVNQSDWISLLLIHIDRYTNCTSQSSTWYVMYVEFQYTKVTVVLIML